MVLHGLQLCIQIIIDAGNHVLASIGENRIEDYTDIIDRLGERDIIPADFARRIRGMVGLRNILIHEYARLDLKTIYDVWQHRLDDFRDFRKYIEEFLST